MTKQEKSVIIAALAEKLQQFPHFYLADISGLDAEQTADLRAKCFEKHITLQVVKNTLFTKALEQLNLADEALVKTLEGNSAVMFTEVSKAPAQLIKEFRKAHPKPLLKAAWVEQSLYVGDGALESLVNIKSKEELIGMVIGMLRSPLQNVVSGLQASGGGKVAGLVKSLEERAA